MIDKRRIGKDSEGIGGGLVEFYPDISTGTLRIITKYLKEISDTTEFRNQLLSNMNLERLVPCVLPKNKIFACQNLRNRISSPLRCL
jgi:hypothetical protein